ncbi:ABC transporter substrate-binding protein [Nigerium massiliense]|uniref:ABC transporter substrate-binding protein n=1 Tax=Nigerium massiliense TaxID=1522317 RepID=UPI00058C6F94|nr:ABC transporter substrate-binding protein [Nigerium massiliense]
MTALLAAIVIGLVPVLAATPARAEDAAVLKLAAIAEIDSFNPFTTYLATPININRMQFESLVEAGKDNEPVGGFAEKWETSPDGRTWTFTIPDGRKWSDGQPATADDAAYTLTSIMTNEKLASANGSLVSNFASVQAKDPKTLVINMKAPQAGNPGLEIPIVPKHIWEKQADPSTYLDEITEPVVGSGPFQVTKYVKEQSVELKANPNFWRGPAKIGGINWVYYKNIDAAVQGLKAGEIDLVSGLTVAQFNALKNDPNIATSNGAGRRYQGLAANPGMTSIKNEPMGDGNPVLKDPVVRQAIFMAVDRNTIVDRVLGGYAKPGITEVPTVYKDYFGLPAGAQERPFDIAAANKLLDDAGYTKGSDGIRIDKATNKPIRLRLMGRNTVPEHSQMADYVKPWLKQIGVDVTVQMVAGSKVSEDSAVGKYDLYFTGWGIGPDPDFQLSINQCASRPNKDGTGMTSENGICDPEFDKLYQQQHAELDPAKRADLVKQAYQRIYDSSVLDVLYYADQLEAYRKDRWNDFQRQPSNGGPISAQNSYWGLYSASPIGSSSGNVGNTGLSTGAIAGIVIAAVVVIGGAVFLLRRRRSTDDRE